MKNIKNKTLILQPLSKDELIEKFLELEEKFEELVRKNTEFEKIIKEQDILISDLQNKLKIQETRLNRNSKNSSQPPSTDQFVKKCKPQSERRKSGKASGGQPGHNGVTLQPVENPDIIEYHNVQKCDACECDLSSVPVSEYIRRQEIDIPPIKPQVTEHRIESKICPKCTKVNEAKSPRALTQAIQYGTKVQALAAYFHYEQLIPLNRSKGMFLDLFGLPISEGTLVNMHCQMYEQLEQPEKNIKAYLLKSDVLNFDETGLMVNQKNYWLHSASNDMATAYYIDPKRGREAMDRMGILPFYNGIASHDHYQTYFTYTQPCGHSLCNTHHVRELRGIFENYGQTWCFNMRTLLYTINNVVNESKRDGKTELSQEQLSEFSKSYDVILGQAQSELPVITPSQDKKRGKPKQHPAKNMHDRLVRRKKETLLFMHDFRVPFTNNQAEQDVRMAKVKQKISGCFRSDEGARRFTRIRGYTSTARKQGVTALSALEAAARGKPPNFYRSASP